MYDATILRGRGTRRRRPDWKPLETLLPLRLCGPFMWMHEVELEDGTRVQAYKHSTTRRYLLVDAEGDTWEDLDAYGYRRMRHSDAIEFVLHSSWLLHHADQADRDALREAIDSAHDRGNGDAAAGAHILPSSPSCAGRRLPVLDEAGTPTYPADF